MLWLAIYPVTPNYLLSASNVQIIRVILDLSTICRIVDCGVSVMSCWNEKYWWILTERWNVVKLSWTDVFDYVNI